MMKPETTTPTTEQTESVTIANPEAELAPEVQSAMFLQSALPMFRSQLDKLTGTQAKRVLSALMEAPLEKETPGFTTREAEDLFALGLMISNAKFILFNVALKDKDIADRVEQEAKVAGAEAAAAANTEGEKTND